MQETPAKTSDITVLNHELLEVEGAGKRLYTVSDLVRVVGISRTQVGYWRRNKLLIPTLQASGARGSNPAYFYSPDDVMRALIFAYLKQRRFSLRQIKQVARNIEKDGVRLDKSGTYLLTDGYSVYYANNDHEAVDVLKHHGQMLLLVPIHEQLEKLRTAA